MKSLVALALVAFAVSTPVLVDRDASEPAQLNTRATGPVSKEFTTDGCRDVIFVYARGAAEAGNMGATVGPTTSDGLKKRYGENKVATEGVDYAAAATPGAPPTGADPTGVAEMKRLLINATATCPNSKIVAGGNQQGAEVARRSIDSLPDEAKSRILGVVTYGDPQTTQEAQIPNFPKEKVRVMCNAGASTGTTDITPTDADCQKRVPAAVEFLVAKIGDI